MAANLWTMAFLKEDDVARSMTRSNYDLIAEWTDTDKATTPRKPKRKWHKTADKPPPEDVHLLGWWADFVPALDCFMKEHGNAWVGGRETTLPDYWRKLPKGPET
ncbi:MAG: hypothetical protein U5N55_12770 [Cypionkella sp.]|nr:hypothetical protein [Cypionkella sp.]